MTLRYWTAGESHGKALVALVDGFPAGVKLDTAIIDQELRRRQEMRHEKITRVEKEKSSQLMHLRGNLRKILKKGRSIRLNLKEQALLAIQSMDEQSKNTVLGILAELDSLEAYDGLATIDRVA